MFNLLQTHQVLCKRCFALIPLLLFTLPSSGKPSHILAPRKAKNKYFLSTNSCVKFLTQVLEGKAEGQQDQKVSRVRRPAGSEDQQGQKASRIRRPARSEGQQDQQGQKVSRGRRPAGQQGQKASRRIKPTLFFRHHCISVENKAEDNVGKR